ncbi:MAG TPA: hypothetical protein VN752_06895 [Solirubrobacterales bacterium]|nr:hypothetical protein [Solirubrobacterales bacterium]
MTLRKTGAAALTLAAIAIALTAASSATAGTTALCEKFENPCEAASVYVGHIAAVAEDPRFLTSEVDITCKKSQLLGFNLGLGNPLTIHLQLLTFTEDCLTENEDPCVVQSNEIGLPLLLRTEANKGTLQFHDTLILVSCPGAFIHCVYGGLPVLDALGSPNGETLATFHANEVPLEGQGFCPEETKFDALYKLALPDPIVISS